MPLHLRSQRTSLFVDVQSLFLACKDIGSVTIDYDALLKEVIGERPCARAVAYAQYNQEADVHGFSRALYEKGFEVKAKPLRDFKNELLTWSIGISLDMVEMVGKTDVIVLVSHDPDFEDTLRYLSSKGVGVEVWGFESALGVLKHSAGKFHFLNQCKKFLRGNAA